MDEERTIWRGNPSQGLNFKFYLIAVLLVLFIFALTIVLRDRFQSKPLVLLIAPAILALWKWIEIKSRVYDISTERIKTITGILSKETEELELYRVKDTTLLEPLSLRLFHAGTIILTTNDQTNPRLALEAIPAANQIREELRKYVEICRQKRGVRIAELE